MEFLGYMKIHTKHAKTLDRWAYIKEKTNNQNSKEKRKKGPIPKGQRGPTKKL